MPELEGPRVHRVFPLYNTGDWGPERRRDLLNIVLAEERPKPGFPLPGQGSFPELHFKPYFGLVHKPAHLWRLDSKLENRVVGFE